MLSPILYCVYVDDLLLRLSKVDVGCFIGLPFVVALDYADDLVLSAPTTSAMRKPLAIASPSMHLNPNVWLPYLRIIAKLSKRSMIVFFTTTIVWWPCSIVFSSCPSDHIRFGWRRRYYNQETFFYRTSKQFIMLFLQIILFCRI